MINTIINIEGNFVFRDFFFGDYSAAETEKSGGDVSAGFSQVLTLEGVVFRYGLQGF